VFLPFLVLMVLIGAAPALLVFGAPLAHALAAAAAALALGLVGATLRPREGNHFLGLVWPWIPVAAVPALWTVIQALPMPLSGFVHPIWVSASAALATPVTGAISIDPGMTLLGLGRYLFAIGVLFATAAVAINRRRAVWTLFTLSGVTALLAALLAASDFGALALPDGADDIPAALRAIAALGLITSSAAILDVYERHEMRREDNGFTTAKSAAAIAGFALAAAVCGLALVHSPPGQAFASLCGVAVFALIVAARRLGLTLRTAGAVAAAGLLMAAAFAMRSTDGRADLFTRFAATVPTSQMQRIVADAVLPGSGAGTFSALLPIYGSAGDVAAKAAPPTAAAAIAVELGRPMWAVIVLIAAGLAIVLFRGAMRRGRDTCYPAAAAGCVLAAMMESFVDAALFDTAVILVASGIAGLGLAQSASRTLA
jgi:hypothetical protein